ncbi:kinase-like domain-containing protein [Gigaspora rosea]|uniref:Kinase-like domain-containing protein n=1 Tax=Gigaspora rosea TaxID=44941 RepID=A0A397VTD6_9GLOM|nr:kinase-like domain-containing protein [Gigaspora rosea]
MENPPKENERLKWFQKAIEDKLINFFDFTEFSGKEKIDDKGPSSVYKSEWTNYGLTVVLKGIKFDVDGNDMNSFVKELQLLQRVSFHPKINHFYGVTKDPAGSYMIVLHHANNGDLREYLKNNSSKLKWDDKYRIAGEISQGLAFLHKNNIAHRNLMMITDFGFSKLMTSESSSSNSIVDGMPAFIDPQCFKNPTYKRTDKTDIYSYGVILWEISSVKKPFCDLKRIQIAIKIYNGDRETPVEGTPPEYVDLYKRCWDDEPDSRPKIEEILDFFGLNTVEQTNTHVNTEGSSDGLLEEAISKNSIKFYDYNLFSKITILYEEEISLVYTAEWKQFGLTVVHKHLKIDLDKKIIKETLPMNIP